MAIRNLRLAWRHIRRAPGSAITAIVILALGIGLSVAVFTVAETLLIRKLPVVDQDRLVTLWGLPADHSFGNYPLSLTGAREFTRQARSLESVALFAYEGAQPTPVRETDQISRLRRALVSGNFFDVLGTRALLGRALRPDDDVVGAAPVAVISHSLWQRRFGAHADILGQQIVIHGNDVAYTVVGVMPPGIDYPTGTELWAPLIPAKTTADGRTEHVAVDLVARLRVTSTASTARQELTAYYQRPQAFPWERDVTGVAQPLPRVILGDVRPAVLAFSAAGVLLLLITCVNVANLLLVRGLARTREIAVRSALGASRRAIVEQLLAESSLLAIAGGTLGTLVALGAVRTFVALAPAGIPRLEEIHIDATALIGAAAITGIAMLLFGLAPAMLTSRVELQDVLRSGARQSTSRGSRLAAQSLVVAQVTLAVLVLSAAGLIGKSLFNLQRAELSLDPSHLLIGELAFRYDQVDSRRKQLALLDRVLPAVRAVPGIEAVSPVVAIPFSGSGGWDGRFVAPGQSAEASSTNPILNMEVVVPDYFATVGLLLARGRAFTEQDREGEPLVVIVSQSTARHFWPGKDPIGQRLLGAGTSPFVYTVVGVVRDTRYRDLRDARPSVYFPLHQSVFPFAPLNLAMRTAIPPAQVVSAVRRAVAEAAPGLALASAAPFESYLDGPLSQPRLNALLLMVFAGAAVMLAAVGLFGVMATSTRQRTRELGIRMALGATGADLSRMVLGQGMTIAASGVVVGLGGAMLANRLLSALLYEVTPTDGVTLSIVAITLLLVASLACLIPARTATRTDPVLALRSDT